jgi:hypothetical protein
MSLMFTALSFALASIWLKVTFAAIDKPVKPFWVNENLVLYITAPMVSGLLALGAIFAMKTVFEFPPALSQCGYALLILGVTVWILRRIKKEQPIQRAGANVGGGQIIEVDFTKDDQPPKNGTNNPKNPGLKKAA